MNTTKETFTSLFRQFEPEFSLITVFDDFLTMACCSLSPNPQTGTSHYEDLYLKTIEPYKESPKRFLFPLLLNTLVDQMTERVTSHEGNDILGEFYTAHFKGKLKRTFSPWGVCSGTAKILAFGGANNTRPLSLFDPQCGSGRMLLALSREFGPSHLYMGVDVNLTCVKMTVINLFLNGVFNAEIMCADTHIPHDFKISYRLSSSPLGIFLIPNKEDSQLWKMKVSADIVTGDFPQFL